MTKSQQELLLDLSETGFQFLSIDLDMAMTFTQAKEAGSNKGKRLRNIRNALKAYDKVSKLRGKLALSGGECKLLEGKAKETQASLGAVGGENSRVAARRCCLGDIDCCGVALLNRASRFARRRCWRLIQLIVRFPTTRTKITASTTAYSAMSCPRSSFQSALKTLGLL
jgi:hypothetical protein